MMAVRRSLAMSARAFHLDAGACGKVGCRRMIASCNPGADEHAKEEVMTVGGSTQTFRRTKSAWAAVLVAAAGTAVGGQRAADPQPTDWPHYNRTLSSDRFSPLAQINKSNVSR